jgi:type II restriction enzyme
MIANRNELNELYVFFHLLACGHVTAGGKGKRGEEVHIPVIYVQREEHDGTRRYWIEPEEIHVRGAEIDKRFPREDFQTVANYLLHLLQEKQGEEEIDADEAVELFLDALKIYNLEAETQDRTDMHLCLYHESVPPVGYRIYSRLCRMNPLLDGGRAANLKFEQTGIRFPQPTINKINFDSEEMDVARRMLFIESLGGMLKYNDVADKVFRSNLYMLDIHFPRMLAEMVRTMHLDNITRVSELVEVIKEKNPLKVKQELIDKHHYYEFKMKQFLLALAFGMRPAKLYDGTDGAVEGFLMVDREGNISSYNKSDTATFANFLYYNTRLEKGSTEKDKYGYLERENGVYYFKLNLKIGWTKK